MTAHQAGDAGQVDPGGHGLEDHNQPEEGAGAGVGRRRLDAAGSRTPAHAKPDPGDPPGGRRRGFPGRHWSFGGESGHELSYLPQRQSQRARWSQPGDGVLDPKKVRAIRIGWGDYLGVEGETVRFSTALPKLVSDSPGPKGGWHRRSRADTHSFDVARPLAMGPERPKLRMISFWFDPRVSFSEPFSWVPKSIPE